MQGSFSITRAFLLLGSLTSAQSLEQQLRPEKHKNLRFPRIKDEERFYANRQLQDVSVHVCAKAWSDIKNKLMNVSLHYL